MHVVGGVVNQELYSLPASLFPLKFSWKWWYFCPISAFPPQFVAHFVNCDTSSYEYAIFYKHSISYDWNSN